MSNKFLPLKLDNYYNNDGISFDSKRNDGNFDSWGRTYPAEELPKSGSLFEVNGTLFIFPDKIEGKNNNISMLGQLIEVTQNNYKYIHILGASENGCYEDDIKVNYDSESVRGKIRLHDFFFDDGPFNNAIGIECSHYHEASGDKFYYPELVSSQNCRIKPKLWQDSIEINNNYLLNSLELGDNPCMHIFCITLEKG